MTDTRLRFVARMLLGMVLLIPAANAASDSGTACAALCGNWKLDAEASDAPEPVLDAAFARFKDPKPERMHEGRSGNLESLSREADERALGPIMVRPPRQRLREELVQLLRIPQSLMLGANGEDVLIGSDGRSPRSLTPGEPHVRVDAQGTAKISCEWRQGRFIVSERYKGKNNYSESYSLQRDAMTLFVTRTVKRQGLPEVKLKSVYRRA